MKHIYTALSATAQTPSFLCANPILSGLHDRLVRLLGNSLLRERDHPSRRLDRNYRFTNEVISVQEWIAIDGMTQPLAQRCERNGSNVPKETVVETVRNNLAELRARHDCVHGLPGGVTPPSKPGLTAVANEAAPHQTDADAAAARGPSSSDLIMVEIDASEIVASSCSLIDFDHGYDDDDDSISVDETTWGKGSTTTPTTATAKNGLPQRHPFLAPEVLRH